MTSPWPFEFRSGNAAERAGLGNERPDEIREDDDEFDAYRKRMMMAYRFRPNPLVSYGLKVIRKFFLKHNKSFRWHLGDYEKHNFFPFKGL